MTPTTRDSVRIDSRDLVQELAALEDAGETTLDNEDLTRLLAIRELFAEITDYAGDSPEDGIFLIATGEEFIDYAQELAEDLGAEPSDGSWPTYCIDWAYAARELAHDYTMCSFDGVDYYYR